MSVSNNGDPSTKRTRAVPDCPGIELEDELEPPQPEQLSTRVKTSRSEAERLANEPLLPLSVS
jgi:hypothetical protein